MVVADVTAADKALSQPESVLEPPGVFQGAPFAAESHLIVACLRRRKIIHLTNLCLRLALTRVYISGVEILGVIVCARKKKICDQNFASNMRKLSVTSACEYRCHKFNCESLLGDHAK